MTLKDKLYTELLDTKYQIQNNRFNIDHIKESFNQIESKLNNHSSDSINSKSNIIKSLLITFNISNFSDLTIIFNISAGVVSIIEYAGNAKLFDEFNRLISDELYFYKQIDVLKIKEETYRIFYETMENNKGSNIILTITESSYFKPSKFHMLGDIIMDIIKSNDMSQESVFNDLFEDTVIEINNYISNNNINDSEFYLFKFENIYDFFIKMGLEIIIELSETIKKTLSVFFNNNSAFFRISLSEYIVISSKDFYKDNRISDLNNRLDFIYKGIVLQYRCSKIPVKNNKSIYDIFENIYLINNSIKK